MAKQFRRNIRPYVEAEVTSAKWYMNSGDVRAAFFHLERAHILGQESTVIHAQIHWKMLLWGLQQRDAQEVVGQIFRIIGALTKTAIGWVPEGNTGGSRVSPFQTMQIPLDLRRAIAAAKENM